MKTRKAKTTSPFLETGAKDFNYAFREYGLTPKDLEAMEKRVEEDYQREKKAGRLVTLTPAQLKHMVKELSHS